MNLTSEEEHKEKLISTLLSKPGSKPKMQYVDKPGILNKARDFLNFAKR